METAVAQKAEAKKKSQPVTEELAETPSSLEPELGSSAGMPLFLQRSTAGSIPRESTKLGNEQITPPFLIQRKCASCNAEEEIRPIQRQVSPTSGSVNASALGALLQAGSSGKPLPLPIQIWMGTRLGQDFSSVRIHTDTAAAEASRLLQAEAFTINQDIYFSDNRFQPASPAGQRLLAHELTHTVQQAQASSAAAPQTRLEVSHPHDRAEQEAEAIASAIETENPISIKASPDAHTVHRYSWKEFKSDASGAASSVYQTGAGVVNAGVELAEEGIEALIRRVAPGLADLIALGPIEFIKQKIETFIQEGLPSLLGNINLSEVAENVKASFSEAFTLVEGLLKGDAASCETFVNLLGGLRDLAMSLTNNPAVQALKDVFHTISEEIDTVSKLVLAPAFDALRDILGSAWNSLKGVATTISGWITEIRKAAGAAWDWVAEKLGLNDSGEDGVFTWLKHQASEIWTSIKETLAPIIAPIKKVGSVLLAFTPMGQLYLLIKYGPKVVEAVEWLWTHRNDEDIARSAHEQMGNTILPQLIESVQGFKGTLQSAATWLIETLTSLSTGLLELLGSITNVPLLSLAQDFVQTVSDGVSGLLTWGQSTLQSAVETMQSLGQKLWDFIAPYKEVLSSIALAIVDPFMIPVILAGWAWRKLPKCTKVAIIDFLLDLVVGALEALPDLAIFGPLWTLLKPGVLGFLRKMKEQTPEVKEKVSDRIAKIVSGASPEFLFGFVKGFLTGVWEGITDPFKAIWMVIEGLNYVENYFENLAAAALGVSPEQQKARPVDQPASPPGAGATQQNAPLGERVEQMGQELQPPVQTVTGGFWSAVEEYFSSGDGMPFEQLVAKLGDAWDSMLQQIEGAGASLAEKVISFFTEDAEAEGKLGEGVGWLAGTIAFQVLLDVLTAGTWGVLDPLIKGIVKFINWPMEFLGEAFKLLSKVGKYVMDGVKSLGKMVAETAGGALKLVKEALGAIGEKLLAFAEEILARFGGSAAREGTQLAEKEAARIVEREAAQAAERRAAQALENKVAQEAEQKVAQQAEQKVTQKTEQQATQEAEQKAAQTEEKAGTKTEETASEATQRPLAEAAAEAVEVAMQAAHAPIPVLLGTLEATIMPRFHWVRGFTAEQEGSAYMVYMLGSKIPLLPYKSVTTATKEPETTGNQTKTERHSASNKAEVKQLKENPPTKPANLDADGEALWNDYMDYYQKRINKIEDELGSGATKLSDPPRTWASYEEIRTQGTTSDALRGRAHQNRVTKSMESSEKDFLTESDVGISKSKKPNPSQGEVKYPDQLIVDKATGEVTTVSNKSRNFSNIFDVRKQVEADVEELVEKYSGELSIRRRTHSLYRQKVDIKEIVLVYDQSRGLLPPGSYDAAELQRRIVSIAQSKANEIAPGIKFWVTFQ
jgi:Domain of unknown function (DUF4157)